jgi:AcrR family transcriptional regulator
MAASSKTAASQKQARGEKARQKLVMAGLELFGELGFNAASTRDIAEKAGQNIAAINYYFGNKAGLYKAVVQECFHHKSRETAEAIQAANAVLENPKAAPEQYLDAIDDWLRASVMMLARGDRQSKSFMKLMFREQFWPTRAFREFFLNASDPRMDPFARLIAAYLQRDIDDVKTFLTVHALAGPFIGFFVAPEAVRLKAGWKKIDIEQAEQIADILSMQIRITLKGLREGKHG